jgi:hypothetical protein
MLRASPPYLQIDLRVFRGGRRQFARDESGAIDCSVGAPPAVAGALH